MRGALTNGYEWLFMVLTVNPDGKGASYKASVHSYSAAPSYFGGKKVVPEDQADMIAGVLAFWVGCRLLGIFPGVLILPDPT